VCVCVCVCVQTPGGAGQTILLFTEDSPLSRPFLWEDSVLCPVRCCCILREKYF